MALPSHPTHMFTRLESKPLVEMPKLAPGEPVPPGFEDVVKRVTQIQATLDSHKSSPLIGLEYLVELVPDETGKEPMYVCMLCDKKGDPRVAMAHITSYNHRSKYIGIHFPTVNKALFNAFPRTKDGKRGIAEIVTRICAKIEAKYGRLQPLIVEREAFDTRKDKIVKQILEDHHFRESPNETFVEMVDVNVLQTLPVTAADDAPLAKEEENTAAELSSKFFKGKISCDRSRLRIRDAEDNIDDIKSKKLGNEENEFKGRSCEKMKLDSAAPNRKSLSSISSLSSSSSLSRSRSRSRSHSKSKSRSRSRSYSRSYVRHGWREGKYGRGSWSRSRRSRSGSRGWRRSRSKSHSRRSRSISPGSRYGRRLSPDSSPSRGRYRYGHSHSPKYSRYHDSQSDERYSRHREKSTRLNPVEVERTKWMKFRVDVDKMECELAKDLKFYEKNPEKHPMYPEEWKKFWNRRYKELQADGKDPSKHDFKPEWIDFWNKRMKEMHEEEIKNRKEELRLKLGLPKEDEIQPPRMIRKKRPIKEVDVIVLSPPSNEEEGFKKDVTVNDIKNTWKALTGSEIKDTLKRSPSPWEDAENSSKYPRGSPPIKRVQRGGLISRGRGRGGRLYGRNFYSVDEQDGPGVVTVLRLLTAMESQLGSLGPRVNTLLATALSLEKASPNSSSTLLANSDNFVLLETVKEKLKGQLFAGIVERNVVMATKSCIQSLADLLSKAEESSINSRTDLNTATVIAPVTKPLSSLAPPKQSPTLEPVTVPGVGTMDKVAIAQQIAAALVAQGKTNVTQEQLEQLISAVVGMAKASAGSEHPISTASFVSQMKAQQHNTDDKQPAPVIRHHVTPNVMEENSPLQRLLSVVTSGLASTSATGGVNSISKLNDSAVNALELLQSAYDEPKISPHIIDVAPAQCVTKGDKMEDLTEEDLQTLLQNFKDLSSEEQQGLITYLKKLEMKEPERVEKLRQFVNLDGSAVQKLCQNTKSSLKMPEALNIRPADQLGRLSPFSLRQGGINPCQESGKELDITFSKKNLEEQKKLEDSDDDYSFEDIYAAASQKVKEREKAKVEEEKIKQLSDDVKIKEETNTIKKKSDDPTVILKETKEMIASLMGQLPGKFIQKQTGSPGSRKDSPAVQGFPAGTSLHTQRDLSAEAKPAMPNSEVGGQKIQALGSETAKMTIPVQAVPTLDCSRRMYQSYGRDPSYNSQYGRQQSFPSTMQTFPGNSHQSFTEQQPTYSGVSYGHNSGYYGDGGHQQYSQHNYSEVYQQQGPNSGGWNNYPELYGQQPYQTQPVTQPYSQYPSQPSGYY
ncbi:hypothetical protein B7P43_G01165 [Cryptotermes secundus]|nr:hypothetical protein B7P43_G01165 [Cryptotermes secundus]PNF34079.1 hypothetical protein B7P43_G01165 [Cryptotermes secundus]